MRRLNKKERREYRKMQVQWLKDFDYKDALAEIQGGYELIRDCQPHPVARFVLEGFRVMAFFNLQVYRFFAFLAQIA
jgi:hypothetical protein